MKIGLWLACLFISFLTQAQSLTKEDSVKVFHPALHKPPQPLYIVDGIMQPRLPVDSVNTGLDINPETIEKVEVIKGKNAILLYGDSGKNGVVLITTKKGKNKKSELH